MTFSNRIMTVKAIYPSAKTTQNSYNKLENTVKNRRFDTNKNRTISETLIMYITAQKQQMTQSSKTTQKKLIV